MKLQQTWCSVRKWLRRSKLALVSLVYALVFVVAPPVHPPQLMAQQDEDCQERTFDADVKYANCEENACGPGTSQTNSAQTGSSLASATKVASPFTGEQITPTAIILHWTAGEYDSPEQLMQTLRSRVDPGYPNGRSVQLTVDKEGQVYQLTESLETRPMQTMADQGWNDVSIGIEIESGSFGSDMTAHENDLLNNATQYQTVLSVVRDLMSQFNIENIQDNAGKKGIFGHYDANPGNSDPGVNYMAKVREDLANGGATSGGTQTTPVAPNCICGGGGSSQLSAVIREPYKTIFEEAATAFDTDVNVLTITHAIENQSRTLDFRDPPPPYGSGPAWPSSGVGASGPFQFMPATWEGYKVDGDGDGDADIQDLVDAAHGAANLLHSLGVTPGVPFGDPANPYTDNPTVVQAWIAYNWGPAHVEDRDLPLPSETQDYLEVGQQLYQELTGGGGSGGSSSCVALGIDGCPTEPVDESQIVEVVGIRVHPCIADEVERIINLANAQGLNMGGGGYRSMEQQIQARINNNCPDIYNSPPSACSPPTARPGESNHERGSAVDFTCDGNIFSSRSHPCWIFLSQNTSLINLESEPWHWSNDGH